MSETITQMHLIVYISDYTGQETELDQVLADITEVAKQRNLELLISGLLFYQNGNFLQIIEGSRPALETLMSSIKKDRRHQNIVRLIDEPVSKRGFSDWNMDSFNLSRTDVLNMQELEKISESFRANPLIKTELLAQFFKHVVGRRG